MENRKVVSVGYQLDGINHNAIHFLVGEDEKRVVLTAAETEVLKKACQQRKSCCVTGDSIRFDGASGSIENCSWRGSLDSASLRKLGELLESILHGENSPSKTVVARRPHRVGHPGRQPHFCR